MCEGSFKIYLESLYQNLRPTTFWEVIFVLGRDLWFNQSLKTDHFPPSRTPEPKTFPDYSHLEFFFTLIFEKK